MAVQIRTRSAWLLAVLTGAVSSASAFAQDDDWERIESSEGLTAAIAFTNAPTLTVTCASGRLTVLVGGLSAAPRNAQLRGLTVGRGEQSYRLSGLIATPDQAFGSAPALMARVFRRGGTVVIRTPDAVDEDFSRRTRRRSDAAESTPEPPAIQYNLPLPTDSLVLREVMDQCNTPLDDPRDDLPQFVAKGYTIRARRDADMPDDIDRAAVAFISCVTGENGRLTQCVPEAEFPLNSDVARTAARYYEQALVRDKDLAPAPTGQLIRLTMTYGIVMRR